MLEAPTLMIAACLVLAAILIGAAVARNWKVGLVMFLLWIVFEDLPRKFLQNNMLIYFIKDGLAVITYLSYMATRRDRLESFNPGFLGPLMIFALWGGLQALNPNSPSVLYGILGLKVYFFYVPLMFLGYSFLTSPKDLQRLLMVILVPATVIGILGIVQAVTSLDFLNPTTAPAELALINVVRQVPSTGAQVPRPTSVFTSDGRFASYMLLILILSLGAVGYPRSRRHPWQRAVPYVCVAVAATALLLQGSRGGFLLGTFTLVAFLVIHAFEPSQSSGRKTRRRSLAPSVALAVTLALAGVALLAPRSLAPRLDFYYETLSPSSEHTELLHRVGPYSAGNFVGAFRKPHWITGNGIGTNSLGAQYLVAALGQPEPRAAVESGFGSLVIELGFLGPILWLAWTIPVMIGGCRTVKMLRHSQFRTIGISILWFAGFLLFVAMYGGLAPYQNYVLNAFFWLFVGVLFRLPTLRSEGSIAPIAVRIAPVHVE